MFRIAPIIPGKGEANNKEGAPLHVSLSTSTHDHNDPEKAGIILTIGRTGCDVNFPDVHKVDGDPEDKWDNPEQDIKVTVMGSDFPTYSNVFRVNVTSTTLENLTQTVALDGRHKFSETAPFDCNIRGLRGSRIQRVPLTTPLHELASDFPINISFAFQVDPKTVHRRSLDEGPRHILRLVTNRECLIRRSWEARDGGVRRFMPVRNDAEHDACCAAGDGIVLVVEQGGNCDGRLSCTRVEDGKEFLGKWNVRLTVQSYGQNMDPRPIDLDMCQTTSRLLDLMKEVDQKRRIQPELQRLSLAGRELSDPFQTLAECGIKDDSILILTRRKKLVPIPDAPVPTSSENRVQSDDKHHFFSGRTTMTLTRLSFPTSDHISVVGQRNPQILSIPTPSFEKRLKRREVVVGSVRSDNEKDPLRAIISIKRIPLNLCPSKVSAMDRLKIEAVAPSIGVTLADSAIGINAAPFLGYLARTHLLIPQNADKQVPTMKSLSAWCLNMPIVTPDFVLRGLRERKHSRDPLPEVDEYSPWGQESGIRYSDAIIAEQEGNGPCQGCRDPLKGFYFVSLMPSETEGLVLAAGAYVFRAYLLQDTTFFDDQWLKKLQTFRCRSRSVVVIEPMAEKVKTRSQFLAMTKIPMVSSHEVVASVIGMKGSISDTNGNVVMGGEVPSFGFRTDWVTQKIYMDYLPPDAIRLVLRDFIGGPTNDLLSLIRLAATSKGLQKCVFEESPLLWTVIDMTVVDKKYRKRLRDWQLESLLRRANAVSVTKRLSLEGCRGLRGSGITPLFGSTMLQEVDLRFCGGSSSHQDLIPDTGSICRVIESMPPFNIPTSISPLSGLRRIEIDASDARPVFVSTARKAALEKLTDLERLFGSRLASATCCSDCQTSIRASVSNRQANAMEGSISDEAKYCFCPDCKDLVCGDDVKDCRSIQWCDHCGKQSCTRCTTMDTCRSCEETYCCYDIITCGSCARIQCEDCAVESDFLQTPTCSSCDVTRCSDCRAMDFCEGCERHFCRGLHDTTACSGKLFAQY